MRASADLGTMRMRSVVQPLIVYLDLSNGDLSAAHKSIYFLRFFAARISGIRFCV